MAIKKSMVALTDFLADLAGNTTIASILANPQYTKLVEAGKGGFTGEDSFVTIDGNKVARICAMTGAVFAHDNTDKTASFFYKNGSYMIGAEVVKANARKAWETSQEAQLQELEDLMMDEENPISPKEWKERTTEVNKAEFDFTLDDRTRAELISNFDGYADKDAFTEAYNSGEVAPFTDYTDQITALREAGKPQEETETVE